MRASKAKGGIPSLLPISRQICSFFQENRISAWVMVTWEDKCHHAEYPPSLVLSPHLFFQSTSPSGMGYLFDHMSHCALPSDLCAPPTPCWEAVWEGETPWLCEHCSAAAEHQCVINTVFIINPKYSTTRATVKKMIVSQPKPEQEGCSLPGSRTSY